MKKIVVYGYKVKDGDKFIELPSKRPIADIEELGGIVVGGSAQTVTEEDLRADGRYLPRHCGPLDHSPEGGRDM